MICSACEYETSRLWVGDWHLVRLQPERGLAAAVSEILTPETTRSLPPQWRGSYTLERARAWIAERDEESPTLLVTGREAGKPLGLVVLFELPAEDEAEVVDLRLGYVLNESVWGRGLATELVSGLVSWCRPRNSIRSLAGGVAVDNAASARVLTKNGFRAVGNLNEDEQIYELRLRD